VRQSFAERRFHAAWTPSKFDRTRAQRLRDLLRDRPSGRVLDVGCYDGQLIRQVLDAAPAEAEVRKALAGTPAEMVVGVDVALGALRLARGRGLRPVRAQAELGLPFRDESFATVVAAEVIEHVFDTQAFLAELARVVCRGGWLALTTPNLVALSGRAQLLLGRSPHNIEFDAGPGTSGHIRYFTFDTLELLLRRAHLQPLGRWTNVAHFSRFGSSETVGRWRPSLGHTLISIATKPSHPA
jgi:SAM-dependent methyltransferase